MSKKEYNSTPVYLPVFGAYPTRVQHDTTKYTSTEEGQAALGAYNDAKVAVSNHAPFEFSENEWLENIKKSIQNYGDFSYDLNGDALYLQYKDKYIQQGKLAMADTMGQAAAMTGGYGNSYAQSVGQQAYQGQLDNLNDIVPELYQMALDRYITGKEDLYNQYGMLLSEYEREYGLYSDEYNKLLDALGIAKDDYYKGGDVYRSEQTIRNGEIDSINDYALEAWNANTTLELERAKWEEDQRRYANDEYWREKEYELAEQAAASSGGGSSGGSSGSGSGSGGAPYADTLWYATGTYDDNGNPIFRNSEGKTQSFGQGVNPYTGTKHPDAKNGTFSNGYQPNNIGGTKLKNSGMSTNVTGKNQTIWEANGKYWLWRGDLNKYIEVDISDLD